MPDLILLLKALILGVVEGFTEFIPVSSTGHLILVGELLGFDGPIAHVFDVVIQLGAILAVVAVFRQRLWQVAVTLPTDKNSQHFVMAVLLAFLPAAVIGFFAHDFIKTAFFNAAVVAYALIAGGVVILLVERFAPKARHQTIEKLPLRTALLIGFMQCLAMIPGTSRSGATIIGAVVLGVERRLAAEFSFFLAIPTMLGAATLDIYKARHDFRSEDLVLLAAGFIMAFLAAWPVAKGLIGFVGRYGFTAFAWYRIALGTIMLALLV